jgi:GR25 family glycosyltransferase involved in LPS biosynthesis
MLGKKEGHWGYHQSLETVVNLLKTCGHDVTSRLAHYHIKNRKDSLASQLDFYKYLNENFYIIFEDDIEINEKSFDIIKKIIPFLEKKEHDIDYINLSCVNFGCTIEETEFTIDNYNFGKPYMPLQTGPYIITKKGAKKLLNNIINTTYHVDFEILFVKFFKNFNYYASNPPIITLTEDETTIGTKKNTLTLKL